MTTDLKELRIRLEVFFELEQDSSEEPTALGITLLSAIDLVAILEQGNWKTVQEAIEAWKTRDDTGKAKPKIVS
jgi:hypothetical protein